MSKQALVAAATEDPRVVVLATKIDRKAGLRILGQAFAGSPEAASPPEGAFNWWLGSARTDLANPERALAVEYALGTQLMGTKGHFLFGARSDSGNVQAVNFCWRSPGGPKGTKTDVCGGMSFLLSRSIPSPFHGKVESKRIKALGKKMEEMHTTHAPAAHMYVCAVAVDTKAQGKGLGGAMMRAVSRMADVEGIPCYLECSGSRNREVYKKLGYEEVGCYSLSIPEDEAGWNVPEFFAMVRPAQKK